MHSDLTLSPSFKVKRGQPNLKVLITHLLLILEVCNVKPNYRISWPGNVLMWSDLTFGPSFKVRRWFTGCDELSFPWIQICIGSLMHRSSYIYFYLIVQFPFTAILQLITYSFISFSLPINAILLMLNYLVKIKYKILDHYKTLFSLLKHYWDLYMSDTVCSESLLIFSVTLTLYLIKKLFPGLWGTDTSDAVFHGMVVTKTKVHV